LVLPDNSKRYESYLSYSAAKGVAKAEPVVASRDKAPSEFERFEDLTSKLARTPKPNTDEKPKKP
jgi:hypothetical protein